MSPKSRRTKIDLTSFGGFPTLRGRPPAFGRQGPRTTQLMRANRSDAPASLYEPWMDHDACGVGFVANVSGEARHDIVEKGAEVLRRLEHRGACVRLQQLACRRGRPAAALHSDHLLRPGFQAHQRERTQRAGSQLQHTLPPYCPNNCIAVGAHSQLVARHLPVGLDVAPCCSRTPHAAALAHALQPELTRRLWVHAGAGGC